MTISCPEQYDADVIIAGGGPAGARCAFTLAQSGYSVILFDTEKFPRDKVCGDFVGPVAVRELCDMGFAIQHLIKHENAVIRKAAVYLDGEEKIVNDLPRIEGLPEFGIVIPRMDLDHWILEKALGAGTLFKGESRVVDYETHSNGVRVKVKCKGTEKSYFSKVLVGADGSSSTLARKAYGAKPDPNDRILAVRAYYENVHCKPYQAELYFTSKSFPGYYWFFPTSDRTANVGVGMVLEHVPKEELNLKKLLDELVTSDPTLRERIGAGNLADKIVGWPLSTYNPDRRKVFDRVVLVGDAAGLIKSLNGEGIQYALLSGRWAAETLVECLAKDTLDQRSLSRYEKTIVDELEYDMLFANFIIQWIRNRDLNDVWLKLLDIIVARARTDPKYAAIAGGILAGISPANKAVTPSFLAKTMLQTLQEVGSDVLGKAKKGPLAFSFAAGGVSLHMLNLLSGGFRQRTQYVQWGKGAVQNSLRLSAKVLKDLSPLV
ncbi:MAG TPA: geranylgeranyl reductase family protein [Chryseolinea sp.]